MPNRGKSVVRGILFRRQSADPSLAEGIPGALRVVGAIVKEWPGR
ncbi:hypothetical protein ACYSUO_31640 [Streptomyces sp. UC4497]